MVGLLFATSNIDDMKHILACIESSEEVVNFVRTANNVQIDEESSQATNIRIDVNNDRKVSTRIQTLNMLRDFGVQK